MRVFAHIGLAVMLVITPALCCCQAARLGAAAHTAPAPVSPAAAAPQPAGACSAKAGHPCCYEDPQPPAPPAQPTDHNPEKAPAPRSCACCERPVAALTKTAPSVGPAEPTGELLSPAALVPLAGCSEHPGLFFGLHPPERAGVDARSAALFDRHVLRC